jgi:divalent metal cation (Fe/Co/Zn/Cd) transporter
MTSRQTIASRGRRLEYFGICWNSIEAVVAVAAGWSAGSIALFGFGLDSVVEVFSGITLLWRLQNDDHVATRERKERLALRLVGISFLLLAAYVAGDSARMLLRRETAVRSFAGIVLAFAALIVMPLLAGAKRRVADALDSGAMRADSRQTDFCFWLSAVLLGGLLCNAAFGWWWADPIAGLAMVPFILREGLRAVQGKTCCEEAGCEAGEAVKHLGSIS